MSKTAHSKGPFGTIVIRQGRESSSAPKGAPVELSSHQEREVRAARNQSIFRAVNEQVRAVNETFATMTETFAIACECADANCIEMIEIRAEEYLKVRAEPRHFAVLPTHVFAEVEDVVRESELYVVVEKRDIAGEVAEALEPNAETTH